MSSTALGDARTEYDVIVVGAGLSGVRAARDLGDAGRSVLLLEARDRLGGRVWTRPFRGRSEPVEMGGTWISERVHPFVAEEIGRYGFELIVSHSGELETRWGFQGTAGPDFPVKDLFALERVLFRIVEESWRIDVDRPRDEQDLSDLDVSVATLLDRLGTSDEVREFILMWAGLGSGALASEWSALTALSLIAAMDHSVYGWYGAVTDRFQIGMSGVVDHIAADAGATIALSAPVACVDQTGPAVVVTTTTGRRFIAEHVIVATPLSIWSDINFTPSLPDDKLIPARIGNPGRMRKTWMVVEGIPGNLFASGWGTEFVQLFPEIPVPEGVIALGMCAPPSSLDIDDLDAVSEAVQQFAPGAQVTAVDMHDWAADPYSKGTWMVNPPGMLSRYQSGMARREGRISFAGADIAMRWIGWIEGALETGARAAREALDTFSR